MVSSDISPENDRLSLRLLDALVRNASDAMIITEARPIDPHGPRIVFANDAVSSLTGYSRNELLGATPRMFQGPLTDRASLDRIRHALQEYRPITEEMVNYRKDGSPYWVQLQLMPVAAQPGQNFSHYIGIQRDITLQRQAEQTARASEQRLRHLVENLPIGAVFCHGEQLIANRASEQITGYPREEIQSREQWFRLLFPNDWSVMFRRYQADRQANFPQTLVVTLTTKHGEARQIEFAGYREAEDEVWLLRDVTETQRMQRLMTQAARVAKIGGWEMNLPSRNIYWTEEVYRLHEVDPDTFTPTLESVLSFYDSATRERLFGVVQRAIEQGESFVVEAELHTAKGNRIEIRSVGEIERVEGRVVRLYGAVQDITTLKQAQREREQFLRNLQQTQKLESLGVMAGGIAHDFNNLLTGIIGLAELAREQVASASATANSLTQLIQAGQRAAGLCRQMLAYAGKAQLKKESVDLNQLIHEIEPLLRVSLSKRARLTLSLGAEVPPLEADANQVHQILLNLVQNASEALEDRDGSIIVSTAAVTNTEPIQDDVDPTRRLEPGRYVCLEVCDTGQGIDPDILPRIFEPFFTTKFTGRGLGLPSVVGILHSHGGLLKVDSKLGIGSRFRLFFPLKENRASHQGLLSLEDNWTGQGQVLVVDDEPLVRQITADMVRAIGFEVSEAGDGAEALALLRTLQIPPKAVLLDLTMPRMDGLETLAVLQTLPQPPAVILMSGYSRRELNERYAARGVSGFLQKPFTLSQLRATLRAILTPSPLSET